MNKIIRKLMELGAIEDQSCSVAEGRMIEAEAEKVWEEFIQEYEENFLANYRSDSLYDVVFYNKREGVRDVLRGLMELRELIYSPFPR